MLLFYGVDTRFECSSAFIHRLGCVDAYAVGGRRWLSADAELLRRQFSLSRSLTLQQQQQQQMFGKL
jgi:hypothetical protein